MSDEQGQGQGGALESHPSLLNPTASETSVVPPLSSLVVDVPLDSFAAADYKLFQFGEWIWRADDSRIVGHWYPYTLLTLFRQKHANGTVQLYANVSCPNLRIWNPFVYNFKPQIIASILGNNNTVLSTVDFGTVNGGCGILNAYDKTQRVVPDILDAATNAQIHRVTFRWVPC
jgi:hypothetical protein